MKFKDLSTEDKARSAFYSKLEWEGGLDGMRNHNGFKGFELPPEEQAVFDRLREAMDAAFLLVQDYSVLNDTIEYDDED